MKYFISGYEDTWKAIGSQNLGNSFEDYTLMKLNSFDTPLFANLHDLTDLFIDITDVEHDDIINMLLEIAKDESNKGCVLSLLTDDYDMLKVLKPEIKAMRFYDTSHIFLCDDVIEHFKYETLTNGDTASLLFSAILGGTQQFTYKILNFASDANDCSLMIVYQNMNDPSAIWCRKYLEFISPVDKVKYKSIEREYRFTAI